GDYVVLGWMGQPQRSDPNSAAAALGTAAQFTYRASLREFGESQAWTFTGEQGNELILYLPRNVGSRLDPFIELQAPDGQLLARDDDSGGGLNSFLQGVLPQGGTYTLRVSSAREDCGGEYRLSVERDWGAEPVARPPAPRGDRRRQLEPRHASRRVVVPGDGGRASDADAEHRRADAPADRLPGRRLGAGARHARAAAGPSVRAEPVGHLPGGRVRGQQPAGRLRHDAGARLRV